jgi:hypothetical protein
MFNDPYTYEAKQRTHQVHPATMRDERMNPLTIINEIETGTKRETCAQDVP